MSAAETSAREPLVSVVIPTHNRARLLARALTSVARQSHKNLEIIVVDDASNDDTKEVAESFGDPRIRYMRNNDSRGAAAARNYGISVARGFYVAFLDDDDEWEPNKTAEQLRLMPHYRATLCGYRSDKTRPDAHRHVRPIVGLPELRRGFMLGASTSALMAETDLLRETLFDESLPRCQDWDMCIRLAQRGPIGYLAYPLVRYDDGEHARISNRIKSMEPGAVERELRMIHKHKEFFGNRMYRFHMCRFLLAYWRSRPNKTRYFVYLCRRYGVTGVTQALLSRLYGRMRQRWVWS